MTTTAAQPKRSFHQITKELRHFCLEMDEHELTLTAGRIALAMRTEPHKDALKENAVKAHKHTEEEIKAIAKIAVQIFNKRTAKKKLRELCPKMKESDLSMVVGRIELATLAELHKIFL